MISANPRVRIEDPEMGFHVVHAARHLTSNCLDQIILKHPLAVWVEKQHPYQREISTVRLEDKNRISSGPVFLALARIHASAKSH